MKQKTKLQKWIPTGILALLLAGSTGTAYGVLTDWLIDDFSEGNVGSVSVTETGPSGNMVSAIVAYDGAVGVPAGSCYVTLNWPDNGGQWEDCKIDWDPPGWPGTDVSGYQSVDCDLKVDVANSFTMADGSYGGVALVFQSWNDGSWNPLGGATIAGVSGWQHISMAIGTTLPVPYRINRLNISYSSNGTGQQPGGSINMWVDNVIIKAPPVYVPPPFLGTASVTNRSAGAVAAVPGLNMAGVTTGNGFWDRQTVMLAADTGMSWYNHGTYPVDYSFSIAGYPNSQNAEAYMFLVANAVTPNEGGPDWNEANVICAELQGGLHNATFSFNYKANTVNVEPTAFGTPVTYSTVIGKWILRFTSQTHVQLIAPDNTTMSEFDMPAGDAAYFAETTSFSVYLGMQANQADGMNQPVVYSAFSVSGVPSAYSEDFTADTALDTTTPIWNVHSSSATLIVPSTAAEWVCWTYPDAGFGTQISSSVDQSGTWNDLTGPKTSLWGGRQQLVYSSEIPAGNAHFYRMLKRVPTQLLVLAPGMTATLGTSPGYTGSPSDEIQDSGGDLNFNVVVDMCDAGWNLVSSTDLINLTSGSHSGDLVVNTDPGSLAGGTATYNISYWTDSTYTDVLTVSDGTDAGITSGVTPAIPIN